MISNTRCDNDSIHCNTHSKNQKITQNDDDESPPSDGELTSDYEEGEIRDDLSDISDVGDAYQVEEIGVITGKCDNVAVSPSPNEESNEATNLVADGGQDPEEDDMDEHLMYLRLMALRTLAPKIPDGVGDDFVDEMEELLDEADLAASEAVAPESATPNLPSPSSSNIETHLVDGDVIIPKISAGSESPIAISDSSDSEVVILAEVPNKIRVSNFARIDRDEVEVIEGPTRRPVSYKPAPPNCVPVDMDLSCENEAEVQFFRDQRDPEKQKDSFYPLSYWFLRQEPPPPPPPPPPADVPKPVPMSEVLRFENESERYDAFLRAVIAKDTPSTILSAVSKDKRKRRSSGEPSEASRRKGPRSDEATKSDDEEVDEASLREMLIKNMEAKKKESPTIEPKKQATKNVSSAPPVKVNNDIQKLNDRAVQIKHFPNLFRKVVIPHGDLVGGSEELNATDAEFSLKLDMFLKSARKLSKKPTPPPKPSRKNPPGKTKPHQVSRLQSRYKVQMTTNGKHILKGRLSSAIKNDLMTSNVAHLPLEKQAEYKRLKALIAKKEKLRSEKLSSKTMAVKSPANADQSCDVMKDQVDEEDPENLRKMLLASMKEKKTQHKQSSDRNDNQVELKSSNVPSVASSTEEPRSQGNILLASSDEGRLVIPNELKLKEANLVKCRSEMLQEICKLSAQMSHLRGETKTLVDAQAFADELRQQLFEVEAVISRRRSRIAELKSNVKASASELLSKKKVLLKVERECREQGTAIVGAHYKPPSNGSQDIKKKLALIKSSADVISSNSSSEAIGTAASPCVRNDSVSKQSEDETVKSDMLVVTEARPQNELGDLGSSLAHLRSSQTSAVDPHTQLCRFELLGKCNDDKCQFQHYQKKAKV